MLETFPCRSGAHFLIFLLLAKLWIQFDLTGRTSLCTSPQNLLALALYGHPGVEPGGRGDDHGDGADGRDERLRPTDLSYNLRGRNVSWDRSETYFKTEDANIRYVIVKGHRLHRL